MDCLGFVVGVVVVGVDDVVVDLVVEVVGVIVGVWVVVELGGDVVIYGMCGEVVFDLVCFVLGLLL